MVKVGITGGIGSGKTEVCKIWESFGAYILNADDLAKSLMVEDEGIKKELLETFGPDTYRDDGGLNRPYLADQAFYRGRVEELNRIVHPRIPPAVRAKMEEVENKEYEVFVLEAALLLQGLDPENLDFVVLVLADKEKRIHRVQKRDRVEKDLVIDRMKNQQNFNKLEGRADIIIENNGTLKQLERKAESIYQLFLQH